MVRRCLFISLAVTGTLAWQSPAGAGTTLLLSPPSGAAGGVVTVTAPPGCVSPPGSTQGALDFGNVDNIPGAGTYGQINWLFPANSDGSYRTTQRIPTVLPPYRSDGGGPVSPGNYEIQTPPGWPTCYATFTVTSTPVNYLVYRGLSRAPDGNGYILTESGGYIRAFGDTFAYGGVEGIGNPPPNPIAVGIAENPADHTSEPGYWQATADGGVYTFATAYFGSMGGQHLAAPIVAIAATADGQGYWLAAADGGVFAFGDAGFYGSMGGRRLNAPITGFTPTPTGHGYWLVGADGGVYSFGDAPFEGSTYTATPVSPPVAGHLAGSIVGIASSPDGHGYWLVGADGGVLTYGRAPYYGSKGGQRLAGPVVAILASADGGGYWLEGADGGIFNFGDAAFYGSAG